MILIIFSRGNALVEIDYFNLDLFKYLMYTDISVSSFDVSCIIYVYDTDDGFSEVSTFCVCVCVCLSFYCNARSYVLQYQGGQVCLSSYCNARSYVLQYQGGKPAKNES